jgi:hypothetical protein
MEEIFNEFGEVGGTSIYQLLEEIYYLKNEE